MGRLWYRQSMWSLLTARLSRSWISASVVHASWSSDGIYSYARIVKVVRGVNQAAACSAVLYSCLAIHLCTVM
eukprot:7269991-Prorocentrum_lima.AAC.1